MNSNSDGSSKSFNPPPRHTPRPQPATSNSSSSSNSNSNSNSYHQTSVGSAWNLNPSFLAQSFNQSSSNHPIPVGPRNPATSFSHAHNFGKGYIRPAAQAGRSGSEVGVGRGRGEGVGVGSMTDKGKGRGESIRKRSLFLLPSNVVSKARTWYEGATI